MMIQTQTPAGLTDNETLRYSRHLLLKEVGEAGQLALKKARVLIVGMGGLGSPVGLYLAAAGVGQLVLADFDALDVTNLQRQITYTSADIGQPKASVARSRLLAINPEIQVRSVVRKLEGAVLSMEVDQADVILDCSDNLATRYQVSEACVRAAKPLVSGAAVGFDGQLMVFDHRQSEQPCYHCLFPKAEEVQLNCATSGVLGPIVGTIGSLQALEAIKLLTGIESPQRGRFSSFDGRSLDWFHMKMARNPNCPCCGD
jgi:molybdopterin/thiamine biosynthesis adenylyltransferase